MNESGILNENADRYVRTLEDVKSIIKHAKLDEKNLTEVAQALYYPSSSVAMENLKLLELDDHLLEQIHTGRTLCFKGGVSENLVLCTDERTYEVKAAEISNSLLLVPDLKFAAETSASPLQSPRGKKDSGERNLSDCDGSGGVVVPPQLTLEHRPALGVFHEYFECREIRPRYRKLRDLLQLTRYSGPENEEFIDAKLLFTFEQLLETTQCSREQFMEGLRMYRAIELNGRLRMLECDYEFRIVNLMMGLISENSWDVDDIERDITIEAMDGIAPREIVRALFDLYAEPSPLKLGKFTYREEMVARIVAQNILQPGLKFRMDEFMYTWQDALPEGMKCDERYLSSLGVFDTEGPVRCIRSLAEDNLLTGIHERILILFKTKQRWTLDEIEPYLECFTTPTVTVSKLLAKYTRSVTTNGVRYYLAKH